MTTEAIVDLTAFGDNVRHLSATVAPAELMVVLKADAYGHGLVRMAHAAVSAGARRLGVLDISSALAVRDAGVTPDVTVMAWQYPPAQDFADAIDAHVDLGVSQVAELRSIARGAQRHPAVVHLKIDTGLNRNGATPDTWPGLVTLARELQEQGLIRVGGVWSHIAEASEDEDTLSMECFERAIAVAREIGIEFPIRHLAASSAGLRRSDIRFDMVRMGGHCWGIPSFDGVTPSEIGITPVMTLVTHVVGVHHGPSGPRPVVPLGHADGIPANAAGRVSALVGGGLVPIEEVHADTLILAEREAIEVGARVTLFGNGRDGEQTVRQWGDLTDTLGDEIVTRLGKRIPRRYVGDAAR